MTVRPTDDELAAMLTCLKVQQVADTFGVSRRTVDNWIADMKTRRGERRGARIEARAQVRTKAQIAELAEEMLERAIEVVRDDTVQSVRDRIAQAKLAIEIHNVLIERVANAPKDKPQLGRPELVERVRKATQSASAKRHLHVVGDAK